MRVVVIGAGHVGRTALRSLHEEHECTLVDVDARQADAVAEAMDVVAVHGNGAHSDTLEQAGVPGADLVLACTARDEVNLVSAVLTRRLSRARTVVRATEMDYLGAWRKGDLDVDAIVSSELETANAVTRVLAVPGARHADFFVNGRVQVLEFDVDEAAPPALRGQPLGRAALPADSRVVGLLREHEHILPGPETTIEPGDRLIVMASPEAARRWSDLFTPDEPAGDVVLYGAGRAGRVIAAVLLDRGVRVRVIEPDERRAGEAAARLPRARVFHATGLDPEFLERERIARSRAAVFAVGDDARGLYAAVLAKAHGVPFTMAVVERSESADVFDAAGVDATIDPGDETAEVMVRFAHDRRARQVAMLEDDRFEVYDLEVARASPMAGRPLGELPLALGVVGAIVRDGQVRFARGDDALRPGDRAIVLAETARVGEVLRAL